MSMLRSLSDLFAQSTLRRSSPEYPPHVANAKIAKSCQKQTTVFIGFRFSDHHKQIHAVALAAAAPAPLGSSYPSLLAFKALPYIIPAPFPEAKNRDTWSSVVTQTDTSPFVHARHLSSSPLSSTPFGIHNPSSHLNHPTDRWDWTQREGRILTEHNEQFLTQTNIGRSI